MDVSGVSTANSAKVHLWAYVGGDEPAVATGADGHRRLPLPRAPQRAVPRRAWLSTADGVQLQQYDCNGTNAQYFRLVQR